MTGSITTVSTHDWPRESPSSAAIDDRWFVMRTLRLAASMQQRHTEQVGALESRGPERVEHRFAVALGAIAAADFPRSRPRRAGIVGAIADSLRVVHLRHRIRLDVVRVVEPEPLEQRQHVSLLAEVDEDRRPLDAPAV